MTTTAAQKIPQNWDDARDVPFFRITARLFTPEFCFSASVLLASYDDDTAQFAHAEPSSSTTPATGDTHTLPAREAVPVLLRRTH